MRASRTTALRFGEEHFGGAQLGDVRRQRRLVALATQMANHPGGTLPDKVKTPADLKALYRLMNSDAVTHEAVLRPHVGRTLDRMRDHEGTVPVLHDTTELDYSGLKSMKETLGQIGNGGGRGYKCHNSLAVTAESREVLGLTRLCLKTPVASAPCGGRLPENSCSVRPLWRTSSELRQFRPRPVRQGRRTLQEICFQTEPNQILFCRPRVPKGEKKSARLVLAPRQPRGEERGTPLAVWAVRVWELDPPADVKEPLEWILLTNVPVQTFEDACERLDWYACRWVIEAYHKAMKTGCGIETMEFTNQDRLQPAIALVSVLAVFLLTLRDRSRRSDANERRARDWIPAEYVTVLSAWRFQEPDRDLTAHEFYFALARLGGHQNRKHDHRPGRLVLWRGWTQLHAMVEGALAMGGVRCG